jgi:hypothetical protein
MTYLDDLVPGGHKAIISREFDLYRHYLQVSEDFYSHEAAKEKEALDNLSTGMSADDASEVWAWEVEYFQRVTEDFPQLTRRSTYVAIFALWEAEHRSIAEWTLRSMGKRRGIQGNELRYSDFSGSLYDKSRTVLTRYAGIPDDPQLWAQLRHYAEVRHIFAHSGGALPPEKKITGKLNEALAQLSDCGLSVGTYGSILIEPRLIISLLETAEEYLSNILNRCEAFFDKPRPV